MHLSDLKKQKQIIIVTNINISKINSLTAQKVVIQFKMFTTCVFFSEASISISLSSYDRELRMEDCPKDLSCKSVKASFTHVMACVSFSFSCKPATFH